MTAPTPPPFNIHATCPTGAAVVRDEWVALVGNPNRATGNHFRRCPVCERWHLGASE